MESNVCVRIGNSIRCFPTVAEAADEVIKEAIIVPVLSDIIVGCVIYTTVMVLGIMFVLR